MLHDNHSPLLKHLMDQIIDYGIQSTRIYYNGEIAKAVTDREWEGLLSGSDGLE